MSSKYSKELLLFICATSYFQNSLAIDYNIGPNQTLTSLDSVPWLDLQAGDHVNIHYRPEPYRTKIGLHGRGTAQAPIVIRGIKGSNGELPTLSGENATTPANLNGFFSERWDENLGVILIKRARSDDYFTHKPSHITIEDLRIVGGYNGNTFTDSKGNTRRYSKGAAGVWAVLAENLTIRGSEITDNGNGLFVLSKGGEENISRNILIERNHIYGNGVPGSDRQHNIYTQAADITFQYNEIGQTREGSLGSTLKDRSSGTIIRHNKIESGARVLDLVDPEDGGNVIALESNFNDTYVYGNLILNDHKDPSHTASTNLFHYGGDSGQTDLYRKGTLHFKDNAVFINADKSDSWRINLFDLPTDDETVELINNIFHLQGDSNFNLMRDQGIANVEDTNWITSGWKNGREGEHGFNGVVNLSDNAFIEGDPFSNFDFSLLDPLLGNNPAFAGSPFDANSINVAAAPVPLPAAAWLLISGIFSLGLVGRRKHTS